MAILRIVWDLDDEAEGNVGHIAEHGLTKEDVEEVLQAPDSHAVSKSTGAPVVFEELDADTVRPVTAYDAPPPKQKRKEKEAMNKKLGKELDAKHLPGKPPYRLTRTRRLTAAELARDQEIRRKVMEEFPPAPGSPAALALELRQLLAKLRTERERLGLTLGAVANRSGIDKATLSRLETGKQPNPTLDTILRYAEGLGKTIRWQFVDANSGNKGRRQPT